MSKEKTILVYADWQELKTPKLIGTLYVSYLRGKEIFSFEYNKEWLRSPYIQEIDPDLGLYSGVQYLRDEKVNFGIFTDSAPDRWGRVLMDRREPGRPRGEAAGEEARHREVGIHPAARAREFARQRPVACDLRGRVGRQPRRRVDHRVRPPRQRAKARDLRLVPDRVVVEPPALLAAVIAVEHPIEVFPEPRAHAGRHVRRAVGQEVGRVRRAEQRGRVDQPDPAPLAHAGDRLRVTQMRIHPRRGVDEPGP